MNNTTIKTIAKYALLLCIFYGLEFIIEYFLKKEFGKNQTMEKNTLLMGLNLALVYLFNITTAIIVNIDKKKMQIESKFSVLLTVIYRPLGVVLFLIYLIDKEMKSLHTTIYKANAANRFIESAYK
jgi:putative Mn2+ efflux pump MntP